MDIDIFLRELEFRAVRSSGPGGQHVNKTSSKVEVGFNIYSSKALNEEEKERLTEKLRTRISKDGLLIVQSSDTRSQHRNKQLGITRMQYLILENLKIQKPRKKTKPSKNAIAKRLEHKKQHSQKKINRKPPNLDT